MCNLYVMLRVRAFVRVHAHVCLPVCLNSGRVATTGGSWSCDLAQRGCDWADFTQGVHWKYLDEANGDCESCAQRCMADPTCTGIVCGIIGYCSAWLNGACSVSTHSSFLDVCEFANDGICDVLDLCTSEDQADCTDACTSADYADCMPDFTVYQTCRPPAGREWKISSSFQDMSCEDDESCQMCTSFGHSEEFNSWAMCPESAAGWKKWISSFYYGPGSNGGYWSNADGISASCTLAPTAAPTPHPLGSAPSVAPTIAPTLALTLPPSVTPTSHPTLLPTAQTLSTVRITMAGSVEDYTPLKLRSVRANIAVEADVTVSEVSLSVAAGSVLVNVVMPPAGAAILSQKIQNGTVTSLGGTAVESVTQHTASPTLDPTSSPSQQPSLMPTLVPTLIPTLSPSALPTTLSPTESPTAGCCSTVHITGAEAVQSTHMGLYVKLDAIFSDNRPVYINTNRWYLYYSRHEKKWYAGTHFKTSEDGRRVIGHDRAQCPEAVMHWQAQEPVTCESNECWCLDAPEPGKRQRCLNKDQCPVDSCTEGGG